MTLDQKRIQYLVEHASVRISMTRFDTTYDDALTRNQAGADPSHPHACVNRIIPPDCGCRGSRGLRALSSAHEAEKYMSLIAGGGMLSSS
jgi:hypothetical protein